MLSLPLPLSRARATERGDKHDRFPHRDSSKMPPSGQSVPPLVEFLKQILRKYPEGTQLLELLQNADDAGATEVKFAIDTREHGEIDLKVRNSARILCVSME